MAGPFWSKSAKDPEAIHGKDPEIQAAMHGGNQYRRVCAAKYPHDVLAALDAGCGACPFNGEIEDAETFLLVVRGQS